MLQCHIHSLHYCDDDAALSAIDAIPALQRRRLSRLAKVALHCARMAVANVVEPVDYIVWSSRFGDEHTTLKILMDIAQATAPSPLQFSTSVHNAIAGLYSILWQDETPSICISSAEDCAWPDAMSEACAYLHSQALHSALVIYYDGALPEIYSCLDGATSGNFALAARITLAKPNLAICARAEPEPVPQAMGKAFFEFWRGATPEMVTSHWMYHKC
jgi:hypothetical protein